MITTRVLWHGTTLHRAQSIIQTGPDPFFREPGGLDRAYGFSTGIRTGRIRLEVPKTTRAVKRPYFPTRVVR
jgi:hypothetical protein